MRLSHDQRQSHFFIFPIAIKTQEEYNAFVFYSLPLTAELI